MQPICKKDELHFNLSSGPILKALLLLFRFAFLREWFSKGEKSGKVKPDLRSLCIVWFQEIPFVALLEISRNSQISKAKAFKEKYW